MDPLPPFDPSQSDQLPPSCPDSALDMLRDPSGNWLVEDSALEWSALGGVCFCPARDISDSGCPNLTGSALSELHSSQTGQVPEGVEEPKLPSQSVDPPPAETTDLSFQQPNLTNISQWLDGAYRPLVPCTYCRKNRLQCLIIRTTEANPNPVTSCSSCVALFRECSLAKGEKRLPSGFETLSPVLGHLHGVPERMEDGGNGQERPLDNVETSEAQKESKRFVRTGARILREWFYQNQEYPYPTASQKTQLSQETGFSQKRISTWFANARRRQKQKLQSAALSSVSRPQAGSPMITSTLASMTPMERWQASPPEDEPVPESAIQNAIASSAMESNLDVEPFQLDGSIVDDLFNFEETSSRLVSSVSSLGSRVSESSDGASSAWSHQSGNDVGGLPFPLLPKRTRTRRSRGSQQSLGEDNKYQCTFCIQSFKKRHDWFRHEKSVHLPLDSWICTPDLNDLQHQPTEPESSECRFCESVFPTLTHWEEHEFNVCAGKPVADRSFSRKDHLWQHLRKFHGCTKMPVPDLDAWRGTGANVQSQCGFCGCFLATWTARSDHLAAHFKKGFRMHQWEGDWGLNPSALSVLRDAILPSQRGLTHGRLYSG